MKAKHLKVIFCLFALFALMASGCVQGTAPEEEGPYSVVHQALVDELVQCQESVADCVSSAAGPTEVLECRSEFETCVTTVTEAPVDMVVGATGIPDPTDLADPAALPTGELPVDLPSTELLPELPDVSDMDSVLDCPQSLTDCMADGGDVVECADQARACMGADLPVDMPVELLPSMTLPDTEGGIECMTSLADCVAGGGDMLDCADQARACAGDALPTAELPDVTGLGSDAPSLLGEDLPLVGELPNPLETVAGGADCAQSLTDCMASGDPTNACAEAARSCLENALPF